MVLLTCSIVIARALEGAARAAILALAALLFALGALGQTRAPAPSPPMGAPREKHGAYVGSGACAPCHPSEHASWKRTYHRTMTRAATEQTVLAPLDARGGAVYAGGRRVALVTGSHHEQAYWLDGDKRGELELYPEVWLVEERRFVPRRDAFIDPPDHPARSVRYSSNCIQCHTTAPEPGLRAGELDTEVAELGVACEACHGPGAEHVRKHGDPIERWVARSDHKRDPTIAQPAALTPARGAEVCGQCHAYAYPRDEDDWWTHGYTRSFRPSQRLDASRFLLTKPLLEARTGPTLDAEVESLFWRDGTMRVGGREYNAMILSPCFQEGGEGARSITCTSCHSMHAADRDDQLKRELCEGCHAMPASHTHHAVGSSGSACVACHMPKTSYALFRAIRSHRIDSPRASSERVPACNLCHIDKTRAWTSAKLAAWYGLAREEGDDAMPAVVRWALEGDAAERALAADALGDPDALAISGARWEGPILDRLARDPYAAVRFIAARSRARVSSDVELVPRAVIEGARRDDRPVTIAE